MAKTYKEILICLMPIIYDSYHSTLSMMVGHLETALSSHTLNTVISFCRMMMIDDQIKITMLCCSFICIESKYV